MELVIIIMCLGERKKKRKVSVHDSEAKPAHCLRSVLNEVLVLVNYVIDSSLFGRGYFYP